MGSSRSTCLVIAITRLFSCPEGRPLDLRVIRPPLAFGKGNLPKSPPFELRTGLNGSVRDGVAGVGRRRIVVPIRIHAVRFDDRCERGDALVAPEPHDDDALRSAAEPLDLVDGHADDGAARRDEHHLVAVADDACPGERPLRFGELNRLHAHAAAALARIIGNARALAVAVLGDDEEVGIVLRDVDRDHLVVAAHLHPLHARSVAPHRADFLLVEADRLTELRDHQDVVVTGRVPHADELVALAHLDRDDAVRLERRVVGLELRLLDDAVLRAEDEVLRFLEVARLHDRAHILALPERKQVDDRATSRLARAERQLVHLQPVDLADVREEEDVVVRRGDEEMLDVILVLQLHPHDTDAAALLLTVRRHRQPLDVARLRDRDHHVLFRDQVLELEFFLRRDDLRAAVVLLAVDVLDLEQLLTEERVDPRGVAEDFAELRDALSKILEFRLDLFPREPGQSRKAKVEDRLRLNLRQVEPLDQLNPCVVGVAGRADEGDDRIDVVERFEVALEYMRPCFGLAQLVLRAARDDLALEVEVVPDELEERQRAGHAVDERDGVVPERGLKRRVLEELVERDLRDRVALQLDVDAHAGAVGVVCEIGDLRQHLLLHEVCDLSDDAGVAALLDAVWQLADHDRRLAAAQLLDVCASAHDDTAAAGPVRVADAAAADDEIG